MNNKNNNNLTPADFNRLYTNQIKQYSNSVWSLADLLKIGKEKYGRNALLDMTTLSPTKIDYFIAIASVKCRNTGSLPETHFEVVDTDKQEYWLNKSVTDKLKPTELRRLIRDGTKSVVKQSKIKDTSSWSKNLMIAEVELRRAKNINAKVVIDRIKPLLNIYNRLNNTGSNI